MGMFEDLFDPQEEINELKKINERLERKIEQLEGHAAVSLEKAEESKWLLIEAKYYFEEMEKAIEKEKLDECVKKARKRFDDHILDKFEMKKSVIVEKQP